MNTTKRTQCSTGCTQNCGQGRFCTCVPDVPDTWMQELYHDEPFPRVARWVDEHPVAASVAMVAFFCGLIVLGGWIDGGMV